MTFEEASDYKLDFGKYRGMKIDEVAETDAGLKYLDWITGQEWASGRLAEALTVYLSNPAIRQELDWVMETNEPSPED